MGPAPVVVRMFPMVAGPWGLSAPHFGTSYQGCSSARMTSDSSVEKCGGANEVSCDWVRLHIFVAGKVNDKARVKLAKGAHPLFRCALSDRCVPRMEEHHDDKSTSRATPPSLRLLYLPISADHSTPSTMKNMHTSYLFKYLNPFHALPHLFPPAKRLTTGWTSLGKQEKPSLTN